MSVIIDGGAGEKCPTEPLKLAPGGYTIVGEYKGQRTELELELEGMEQRQVTLEIDPATGRAASISRFRQVLDEA
jgi:hypothetical protein